MVRIAGQTLALSLALVLAAPADARIPRSKVTVAEFKRANPCPANGARRGACPGWQVDHVVALCAGGADAKENMQWLTIVDHKKKTKLDVMKCRLGSR